MIILYTITGLITALFVLIIVTGAVRAHRHPERYGPRNTAGVPRQSRAKGIGRAMLETLPLVKFGDKEDQQRKAIDAERGIEMNTQQIASRTSTSTRPTTTTGDIPVPAPAASINTSASQNDVTNADGTDDSGNLGCSICTEDFIQGEEVRVLPCNHKFHPDCVDPWLLNVSGTCPLCRIDLRPKDAQNAEAEADGNTLAAGDAAALQAAQASRNNGSSRRDLAAYANLRGTLTDSRENRIAALRRFRQQHLTQGQEQERERESEDRRTLAARLRDRFRIRTRQAGESDVGTSNTTTEQQSGPPRRERGFGAVRPTWTT